MTQQYNQPERELGWEDEIVNDSSGFISLTPGDYQFTVTGVERTRHTPNPQNPGKLPACNKAVVSIEIETAEGTSQLKHNLFLHTSTEGMLSAFFGAIGQKKHGEPLRMNWNIIGAKGVCRVNKRKGTGKYEDQEFDNIKSMIYADDVDWSKVLNASQLTQQTSTQQSYQAQQPTYQQQAQQPMQQQPPQPAQGNFTGF
ncbi:MULTISPECIES: hypothetical protein [unclassified Streptococcus]|uniref:hypothetical protein n=1 Tax=unclassified Streptococcus TaxID=2608887 RepID=UPI00211ABA20|nr:MULTISPECIES: hypothetical protein [unclassified Streptococcus]MCQ9212272.1 hypothetical protein [Streptococcus sp. B01]MCQ9213603.1 hypothetical protein [Streptococcus sp. O1]